MVMSFFLRDLNAKIWSRKILSCLGVNPATILKDLRQSAAAKVEHPAW